MGNSNMKRNKLGDVYLICFNEYYKHSKHYLGWTTELERRIQQHRDITVENLDKTSKDRGAVLMAYVNSAGIQWKVARIWQGVELEFELKLKREGHSKKYCPLCCERVKG